MDETWHRMAYIGDTAGGAVAAEACAETGSLWYSGHFPEEPILPGIAILAMVTDAIIHKEAGMGRSIRISSINRVRFKLPVRPDETVQISLSPSDQGGELSYHFGVESKGKTVCTGVAVTRPLQIETQ